MTAIRFALAAAGLTMSQPPTPAIAKAPTPAPLATRARRENPGRRWCSVTQRHMGDIFAAHAPAHRRNQREKTRIGSVAAPSQ
jgi:hypothetical protein